jgi:hypothetical protein
MPDERASFSIMGQEAGRKLKDNLTDRGGVCRNVGERARSRDKAIGHIPAISFAEGSSTPLIFPTLVRQHTELVWEHLLCL